MNHPEISMDSSWIIRKCTWRSLFMHNSWISKESSCISLTSFNHFVDVFWWSLGAFRVTWWSSGGKQRIISKGSRMLFAHRVTCFWPIRDPSRSLLRPSTHFWILVFCVRRDVIRAGRGVRGGVQESSQIWCPAPFKNCFKELSRCLPMYIGVDRRLSVCIGLAPIDAERWQGNQCFWWQGSPDLP